VKFYPRKNIQSKNYNSNSQTLNKCTGEG
ncbi:unnamed protein product, partial [Oikopleura dioica]